MIKLNKKLKKHIQKTIHFVVYDNITNLYNALIHIICPRIRTLSYIIFLLDVFQNNLYCDDITNLISIVET